jgi:hypothetical protein
MKKIYSLLLAVVSTMFLAVGAARAAGTFDALAHSSTTTGASQSFMDGPAAPCAGPDDSDPT